MMKTTDTRDRRRNIVVIGNGMVGQRFCEQLIERDTDRRFRLVTFCQVVTQPGSDPEAKNLLREAAV